MLTRAPSRGSGPTAARKASMPAGDSSVVMCTSASAGVAVTRAAAPAARGSPGSANIARRRAPAARAAVTTVSRRPVTAACRTMSSRPARSPSADGRSGWPAPTAARTTAAAVAATVPASRCRARQSVQKHSDSSASSTADQSAPVSCSCAP